MKKKLFLFCFCFYFVCFFVCGKAFSENCDQGQSLLEDLKVSKAKEYSKEQFIELMDLLSTEFFEQKDHKKIIFKKFINEYVKVSEKINTYGNSVTLEDYISEASLNFIKSILKKYNPASFDDQVLIKIDKLFDFDDGLNSEGDYKKLLQIFNDYFESCLLAEHYDEELQEKLHFFNGDYFDINNESVEELMSMTLHNDYPEKDIILESIFEKAKIYRNGNFKHEVKTLVSRV